MDIQAEKLQLIEWLARLDDIKIIQEIKSLKKETDKNLFKRYSDQDLNDRAEPSMQDIEASRTTELSDFKAEIKSWKQSRGTR